MSSPDYFSNEPSRDTAPGNIEPSHSEVLAMRLNSINIEGFRGISELRLEFPEQVNVLVGVNGVGKSAVLDCTATMLSRLIGRIRSTTGTGRFFTLSDINNHRQWTKNEIETSFQGKSLRWSVGKTRRGLQKQTISGLADLRKEVELFRSRVAEDESVRLPLAVYYPVNRAVLDIPLRIRKRHPFDRLAAYDQALSGGGWGNFRVFFEWFREREDLENENRLDNPEYRDSQLQAVRTATERFLTGFKELKVRRSPLRIVVEKNGEELIVDQLSDGEKCALAMAGDLARRMAIANPRMEDPLQAEAVVLIDEVDLHLHPAWQRRLILALTRTFPKCQFLLSTHSPPILAHLDRESIWILQRTKSGIRATRPSDAYGQTTDRILEDIMDVPARPKEVEKQLTRLFGAIEQERMTEAKRLLSDIQSRIGADPDLVKADVLIRRKETLGK